MTTTLLILLACGTMWAQKIGHINSQEILVALPDYTTASKSYEDYKNLIEKDLIEFQGELEAMVTDFETNQSTWTETKRQLKAQEIQEKQQKLQVAAQGAEKDLVNKEQELMSPLVKKVQDAINDVAKEEGFAYVLDLTTGTVVYWEGGKDVGPMVRKKLGIPEAQ